MLTSLPDDARRLVLHRLPVESLIACEAVSKRLRAAATEDEVWWPRCVAFDKDQIDEAQEKEFAFFRCRYDDSACLQVPDSNEIAGTKRVFWIGSGSAIAKGIATLGNSEITPVASQDPFMTFVMLDCRKELMSVKKRLQLRFTEQNFTDQEVAREALKQRRRALQPIR